VLNALAGLSTSGKVWFGPSALTEMPRPTAVDENASAAPIFLPMKRSIEMPPGGPRKCEALGWVDGITVRVEVWLPCRSRLWGMKNFWATVSRSFQAAIGWYTGPRSKSFSPRAAQV
jgi:hypothetical protein